MMADMFDEDALSGAYTLAAIAALRAAGSTSSDPAKDLPEYRSLVSGVANETVPGFVAYLGSIACSQQELPLLETLVEADDVEDAACALMAALLGQALLSDRPSHWFYYWTSETLRAALPRYELSGAGGRIRREIEERMTLGINLRGRSDGEFLAAVRQVDEHDAEPHDSEALAVLRVILQTSSFCSSDLPRSLALAARSPGRSPCQSMILGFFNGAFYGHERLKRTWPILLRDHEKGA